MKLHIAKQRGEKQRTNNNIILVVATRSTKGKSEKKFMQLGTCIGYWHFVKLRGEYYM